MINTRWIIAAAGAVGVGVLTAAAMFGPTQHVKIQEAKEADGGPGKVSGACQAEKQANLDFTVKDMNGAKVRLADYKGKVILVNFWATWCPPCKVELPGFLDLYAEYKDKGFVILGISGDDDPETLRKFAAEWKITVPHDRRARRGETDGRLRAALRLSDVSARRAEWRGLRAPCRGRVEGGAGARDQGAPVV